MALLPSSTRSLLLPSVVVEEAVGDVVEVSDELDGDPELVGGEVTVWLEVVVAEVAVVGFVVVVTLTVAVVRRCVVVIRTVVLTRIVVVARAVVVFLEVVVRRVVVGLTVVVGFCFVEAVPLDVVVRSIGVLTVTVPETVGVGTRSCTVVEDGSFVPSTDDFARADVSQATPSSSASSAGR